MISKEIEKALNNQISLEGYASHLYLSMASWCDTQGLTGCKSFLMDQSDEERVHMLKIFEYMSEVDGHGITPEIKQPPSQFKSVKSLFEMLYEHEQKVTQSIHELVDLAYTEKDYTTLNFLQWYVEEQREEEDLARTILDKINLIGDSPQSLYFIDMELEKISSSSAG
nr:ferritin [Saprospiraceae bacterium]